MNKAIKSILITSLISVLVTLSILYLYKEFTGINEPVINDTIQSDKKDSVLIKPPDSKIKLVLLLERQKCLEELLAKEREGVKFTSNCGSTSGEIGLGMRYKEIQTLIEITKIEIDSISNLILREENNGAKILATDSI